MINYLKDFVDINFSLQPLTKKSVRILTPITLALSFITMPSVSHAAAINLGDKAPNFKAVTLAGKSVNLADYIGNKPVYLKFWATWCSYCKVEMPHLQAIYDENKNQVEVLTINVGMNDSVSNIERFFQNKGFNIPTIFDQKGEVTSAYGVVGTPYHVLINKQGNVVYQTFLATDQLDEHIAKFSRQAKIANQLPEISHAQLVSHTGIKETQTQVLAISGETK